MLGKSEQGVRFPLIVTDITIAERLLERSGDGSKRYAPFSSYGSEVSKKYTICESGRTEEKNIIVAPERHDNTGRLVKSQLLDDTEATSLPN